MNQVVSLIDVDILTVVLRRALYLSKEDKEVLRLSCSYDQFKKSLNFCSYLDSSAIKIALLRLTKIPFDLGENNLDPVLKEVFFGPNEDEIILVFSSSVFRLLEKNFFFCGVNFVVDQNYLQVAGQNKGEKHD